MKSTIFLLTIPMINSTKLIKNINLPACKNCIHYHVNSGDNDFTSPLNTCSKFGNKNIVTDKITYDFADFCRHDETKCGIEGKYFQKEEPTQIQWKILKHTIISNIPKIMVISFGVLGIILNVINISSKF